MSCEANGTDVSLRCKWQNHPVPGVSQQSSISILMKSLALDRH